MKRSFLAILLSLTAYCYCICFADSAGVDFHGVDVGLASGGETPNQEIGYSTIGATSSAKLDRGIEISVPAGGITVSYGYIYGEKSSGTATVQLAVYNTSEEQIGTCSTSGSVPNGPPAWVEVTWETPFFLSEGTYHLRAYGNETIYYLFDDATGFTNVYDDAATCGTDFTTSSSHTPTMTVANYDAH